MQNKKDRGDFGEKIADSYLRKENYKILERNFRSKHGEIDIIAQDKDTLVFVEVKTRLGDKFGYPQEAVNQWKLKTIEKVGQYFRLFHPNLPEAERIDVIAITADPYGRVEKIELIKNASN